MNSAPLKRGCSMISGRDKGIRRNRVICRTITEHGLVFVVFLSLVRKNDGHDCTRTSNAIEWRHTERRAQSSSHRFLQRTLFVTLNLIADALYGDPARYVGQFDYSWDPLLRIVLYTKQTDEQSPHELQSTAAGSQTGIA